MSETVLEIKNLSIVRSGRRLLDQVDLTLQRGDKVILRGASGSGKSSLFYALAGLCPVEAGSEIRLYGRPATRDMIAFVQQEPPLGAETVEQALLLPFSFAAYRKNQPGRGALEEALEKLGLKDVLLNQRVERLSGGEKQRIALARALLLGIQVFLLDEVTSALDRKNRERVAEIFSNSDFTVLAISHDADFHLKNGRELLLHEQKLEAIE